MIKYFLVFGIKVKVYYKNLRDQGYAGLYYYDSRHIELDKTLTKKEESVTSLHELFHATSDRLGLRNTGLRQEIEEVIVDNFAKVVEENFILVPKYKK